jgi:hypothetical protein
MQVDLRRTVAALIAVAVLGAPALGATSAHAVVELPEIAQASASGPVFVDAMKQASPWSAQGRLRVDPLGNVASLGSGQTAVSIVYAPGANYPAGDYTLSYAGHGTLAVDGATVVSQDDGRMVLRVADHGGLRLRLLATSADDHIRDVRLILPGFEHAATTQPFVPDFVRSLAGADVLHFDTWMRGATYAASAVWPARPTTDRFTQAGADGVAPEYMIALANATGANPWFTLPAGATNYYIYGFAQLVHQQLDPRLHPVFEYGSDAWRTGTPANGWARMAGTNYRLATAPAAAGTAWYVQRSRQAIAIVRDAFGADAGRVIAVGGMPPAPAHIPTRVTANPELAFVASPPQVHVERGANPARVVPPAGKPNYVAPNARPSLVGMLGMPLESIDLAREGTVDWVHFGGGVVDRKMDATERIGALGVVGTATGHPVPSGFSTFSFVRGRGVAHASGGLWVGGVGNGFTLRVPADGVERTLRVYVAAQGAQGVLRARLSDGSASPYASRSLSSTGAPVDGVYSFVYRAAGAGRSLIVDYTVGVAHGSNGRIAMQAATLQRADVRTKALPADVLTFHYNNARTAWDQNEATLTTANVATGGFGLLKTLSVDGVVLAEPLYVSQYNVPNQGVHNLLVVVTENDTVYEFDADTYQIINQRSMGTAQSSSDVGCNDIRPQYGITDTPVIDRSTNTIYLVAATEPTKNTFVHTLHALDIGTLGDQKTPVPITASVNMSNGGQISFNPQNQMTRTSLFEANNAIYVGVGSHCDNDAANIVGWLLKYSKGLQQVAAFPTAEDSTSFLLASIWMTGFASAVDGSGDIYTVTGNGAFDATNKGGRNYGESVVRLGGGLAKVAGFFTPTNWQQLNNNDTDFGSGGIMLLPTQQSAPKALAVAMGKDSKLFLLNRAKLGRLGNALQTIDSPGSGVWGGPAFYSGPNGQFVYYQTDGDVVRAWQLGQTGGKPSLTQATSGNSDAGYGGSSPVVSSNGQNPGSAILWLVRREQTLTLEAYDATNLGTLLFSGSAGTWANPQNNGFVTPLVAGGKVYVPATGTVTVFGLP